MTDQPETCPFCSKTGKKVSEAYAVGPEPYNRWRTYECGDHRWHVRVEEWPKPANESPWREYAPKPKSDPGPIRDLGEDYWLMND